MFRQSPTKWPRHQLRTEGCPQGGTKDDFVTLTIVFGVNDFDQ